MRFLEVPFVDMAKFVSVYYGINNLNVFSAFSKVEILAVNVSVDSIFGTISAQFF